MLSSMNYSVSGMAVTVCIMMHKPKRERDVLTLGGEIINNQNTLLMHDTETMPHGKISF